MDTVYVGFFVTLLQQIGLVGLLAISSVWIHSKSMDFIDSKTKNIVMGLMLGLICSSVMLDPIQLPYGATADARGGIAIISGIIAGPWGAFITALMGSFTRYYIQGGPVALGGVVGFILYGFAGWAIGVWIKNRKIKLDNSVIFISGIIGTFMVIPAFFVSVDWLTGWMIIGKIWPLVVTSNIIGILVVHNIIHQTHKFVNLQRSYEEHEQKYQLLSKVAEETTNVVIITDKKGYITWVNKSFEELTGYSFSEAVGNKPGAILQGPDTDPETIRRMSESLKVNHGFQERIVNYTKGDRDYILDIECMPIYDDDHHHIGFIAIEQDITESVEKDRLLKAALDESRKSNEAKSQFLANMSHELRTPLNAIIGFSEIIKNGMVVLKDDQHLQEYASYINDSGNYLLRIVNDILDLSKIEANKVELFPERIDTTYFINDCSSYVEQRAKKKNIEIVLDVKPTSFVVDKTRMQQAMLNVITNAVKFSNENSKIYIDYRKDDGINTITVHDQGIGIPQDQIDTIMDPFTQLDTTYSNNTEGTGLGLTITKKLIELHHGRLQIKSNVGKGTTVTLMFPDLDVL